MPLRLRSSVLVMGLAAAPLAFALWSMAPAVQGSDTVLSVRAPSDADLLLRRAAAEEDASQLEAKPLGRADAIDLAEREIFLKLVVPETAGKVTKPAGSSEAVRGVLMLRSKPLPSAIGDQLRVRALPEA